MPPKNAAAAASRRTGPKFNPPRPVQATTQPSTSERAPAAAPKKSNDSTSRPRFQPAATIISSGDEQEEDDDEEELDLDSDASMHDAPTRATARPSASQPTQPPIPAPLLARLLYENFDDKGTQIQQGAMSLVGSYMDIFVREAFARAKLERDLAVQKGSIADGFLQVEDLERVAAQLVLDF